LSRIGLIDDKKNADSEPSMLSSVVLIHVNSINSVLACSTTGFLTRHSIFVNGVC